VLFRLLRTLVLVVLAALISNAQCFGNCATTECSPVQPASSDACHHHDAPTKDGVCHHQHASFAGPEAGTDISKASSAHTPFVSDLPVAPRVAIDSAICALVSPHSTSPPHAERVSVSILRV
jgi:hypothetical protein